MVSPDPVVAAPELPSDTPQTEGEYLVGISFNPGGSSYVNTAKRMAADLIDFIRAHGHDGRCTALAITSIEQGAMWGVKSITKPPRVLQDAPSNYAPAPSQLPE